MSTGYLEALVVHMSHDRERIGCRVSTRDLGDNVAKLVLLEPNPYIPLDGFHGGRYSLFSKSCSRITA